METGGKKCTKKQKEEDLKKKGLQRGTAERNLLYQEGETSGERRIIRKVARIT